MSPLPLPEPLAAPVSADTALLAAFEQRLLTRDVPVPLLFDAASVQERLRVALRVRLRQHDPRRLRRLALICYNFMAAPVLLSTDPALATALGLSASGLGRNWRELREAGLVEVSNAGHRRAYRLSRPGEDWLLAVVKGSAAG
jgi:DNA-binding transcriptional ArsR family regulator